MIDAILGIIFAVSIVTFTLWNLLVFVPERKLKPGIFPTVSVIIPAHNEESCVEFTIRSVLAAGYPKGVEIIVVDDGSTDNTSVVVSKVMGEDSRVKLLKLSHGGKANAVNTGVRDSKGDVIVLLDADSRIEANALLLLTQPFSDEKVGAVSGIIHAEMNGNVLVWFQDFEYVLSSMWRYVFDKLNSTYILPGFATFRKKALLDAGGFYTDTLSEDFDIGLYIKKAGYSIVMSKAIMYTNVPQTLAGMAKQRMRWGRGTIQVIRKHKDMLFNPKHGIIGLYGLPNQIYFFVQGFMIIPITFYQVFEGYLQYFVHYNNFLNLNVVKYFVFWFSALGAVELIYNTLTGVWQMTATFPLFLASWLLNTLYNLVAAVKMQRMNMRSILVIIFFFPYYLFTLSFFIYPFFTEINPFKKESGFVNIWEKNR